MLTYKLKGKLAYVPAGRTYEEALEHAVSAFPVLGSVTHDRISFHVSGRDAMVRVPACSWSAVLRDLRKYEIILIEVAPDPNAPPEYRPEKDAASVKKRGFLRRLFGLA